MSNMRNLIEYYGIADCFYSKASSFKQTIKDFKVCIPTEKPDVEQVVRVWVKSRILKQEVVETPKGVTLEGQRLTGLKVAVMGMIDYKIEYVALDTVQSVHTAHMSIPFCEYVVLPEHASPESSIKVSVLVEDIYTKQLDLRSVYNNVTMMLIVDLC